MVVYGRIKNRIRERDVGISVYGARCKIFRYQSKQSFKRKYSLATWPEKFEKTLPMWTHIYFSYSQAIAKLLGERVFESKISWNCLLTLESLALKNNSNSGLQIKRFIGSEPRVQLYLPYRLDLVGSGFGHWISGKANNLATVKMWRMREIFGCAPPQKKCFWWEYRS